MARYSGIFEGRPFNVYVFRGRTCAIAASVGRALDYADDGKALPDVIRKHWGDEAAVGRDFDVLTGVDLREFKALLDVTDAASVSRAPNLMVLFEPGVDLVCLKTEKPLGKKLRRFLADEVMPKLRRGEPILPGNDTGELANAISSAVAPLARAVESLTVIVSALAARTDAMEARVGVAKPANDAPGIGSAGAAKILTTLRAIASAKAGAIGQGGNAKAKKRIRFIEERTLRRELRYPMDRGCSWRKLSEEQFGRAMLILERMDAEASDLARLAARDAGPLFRAVPGPKKTG